MFGKPQSMTPRLGHSTSPWILLAIIASVALLFTQLLPGFSSPASSFPTFSTPTSQCLTSNNRTSSPNNVLAATAEIDLHAHLPTFSSIRVVSLLSRTDRRQHMVKLTQFLNLNNLVFSDAILYTDPRVLEIVHRVGNHTKADKKIAEVGHVACRLSHQLAIQAADRDDDDITLVLEDDVDIESAFKYFAGTILRDVPKDWDIIFFGHTDFSNEARNGRDPRTNNFFIYKSIEPQGGHGYALSRKGRKLLLDLLENKRPEVYETDEGQPIDEIFVYLARLHRAELYSIIPDLIVQVPLFKSDIFGTPAGFEDGMHNKKLLDSSLNRIKLLEKTSKDNLDLPQPVHFKPQDPLSKPSPHPPVSTAIIQAPHSPVSTGIAQAHRFRRTSSFSSTSP